MRPAAVALSVLGAGFIVAGTVMIWWPKSDSPRYKQDGLSFGSPPSLIRYIGDQRRASGVVVVGAALQLIAVVLSILAG